MGSQITYSGDPGPFFCPGPGLQIAVPSPAETAASTTHLEPSEPPVTSCGPKKSFPAFRRPLNNTSGFARKDCLVVLQRNTFGGSQDLVCGLSDPQEGYGVWAVAVWQQTLPPTGLMSLPPKGICPPPRVNGRDVLG